MRGKMNTIDFKLLLDKWAGIMTDNRDYLIDLDSVVGDGDLGLTMSDGFSAARDEVSSSSEEDLGKMIYLAGRAMSRAVPSTMGTLTASGLMEAGKNFRGHLEVLDEEFSLFFQYFFDGIKARGKAEIGDKTVLDGLLPAIETMRNQLSEGSPLEMAAKNAEHNSKEAFLATKEMIAKQGRAAIRGDDSRGILDPGAAVAYLLVKGYAEFVSDSVDK
ncbi:MAG: phosphoenolpyruvate---glycerone phosphotransferase subunit DhaL [Clostridiales bacterium]|jgi:dihydroxyacetone kinase-like protein|nr:phosphoenolpyruvate---glycerone phosphotransferase subunit DhaL [Clostridiales bacterium]